MVRFICPVTPHPSKHSYQNDWLALFCHEFDTDGCYYDSCNDNNNNHNNNIFFPATSTERPQLN